MHVCVHISKQRCIHMHFLSSFHSLTKKTPCRTSTAIILLVITFPNIQSTILLINFLRIHSQPQSLGLMLWLVAEKIQFPVFFRNQILYILRRISIYVTFPIQRSFSFIILLDTYLVHIATEKLILFLQSLYKALWSNHACFLLLRTYLHKGNNELLAPLS